MLISAGRRGMCAAMVVFPALIAATPAVAAATAPGPVARDMVVSTDWAPDTLERTIIRAQAEALAIEYYYRVDHGHAEDVVELYTPDGFLQISDLPRVAGREALRAYYAARSKTRVTRHITANIRLTYIDADHVEMLRDITYYHGDGPGLHPANPSIVTYRESLVRGEDGQWRFAARVSQPFFSERP